MIRCFDEDEEEGEHVRSRDGSPERARTVPRTTVEPQVYLRYLAEDRVWDFGVDPKP